MMACVVIDPNREFCAWAVDESVNATAEERNIPASFLIIRMPPKDMWNGRRPRELIGTIPFRSGEEKTSRFGFRSLKFARTLKVPQFHCQENGASLFSIIKINFYIVKFAGNRNSRLAGGRVFIAWRQRGGKIARGLTIKFVNAFAGNGAKRTLANVGAYPVEARVSWLTMTKRRCATDP